MTEREDLMVEIAALRLRREAAQEQVNILERTVGTLAAARGRLQREILALATEAGQAKAELRALRATLLELRNELSASSVEEWLATFSEGPLRGAHRYHVDPKWRVVIPKPFLSVLGQRVRLVGGLPKRVLLLPPAVWEELQAVPSLARWAQAWAAEVDTDPRCGRLLIPPALRKSSGLVPRADAVVCGRGAYVTVEATG